MSGLGRYAIKAHPSSSLHGQASSELKITLLRSEIKKTRLGDVFNLFSLGLHNLFKLRLLQHML